MMSGVRTSTEPGRRRLFAIRSRSLFFDSEPSEGEQRWITIGSAANGQCLLVVHTWADTSGAGAKARMVSAPEAKNSERQSYQES
jgi:uncharacterized DUF497 family protein